MRSQLERCKHVYHYEGLGALVDHVRDIAISRGLDLHDLNRYKRLRVAMVKQVVRQVKEDR